MVREKRRTFLHKGCWARYKGYAYSSLHKVENKKDPTGKRLDLVEKYGYDTKYAYQIPRLLLCAEQILSEGDIDLQRHREQLKAIRRGEWSLQQLKKWASDKEAQLEKLYHESSLPWGPDEPTIKTLLLNCLEHHFGNLSSCINLADAGITALRNIQLELDKVKCIIV